MIENIGEDAADRSEGEVERALVERVGALEQQLRALAARLVPAEPSRAAEPRAEPERDDPSDEQIDQALARIDEFASALRDQPPATWDARESVLIRAILRDLALATAHFQRAVGDSDMRVSAAHRELSAIRRQVSRGLDELRRPAPIDEAAAPTSGEQV